MPGEDADAFREQVDAWAACVKPQDDMEEYLNYRNVCNSWRLERVENVQHLRLTTQIEQAESLEQDEVEEIGGRLFSDRRGPIEMYGIRKFVDGEEQTSWTSNVDDADHPTALLKEMEATAAGCKWLLTQWSAVLGRLERKQPLQAHDRLMMIRLMGKQPLDVVTDERVALVFLGSYALHPTPAQPFANLLCDMTTASFKLFRNRIIQRWGAFLDPSDTAKARRMMTDLVTGAIERLKARAEMHQERAHEDAGRATVKLSVDYTIEGEMLRREEATRSRTFYRGLGAIGQHRKQVGRLKAEGGIGRNQVEDEAAVNRLLDLGDTVPRSRNIARGQADDPSWCGVPEPGGEADFVGDTVVNRGSGCDGCRGEEGENSTSEAKLKTAEFQAETGLRNDVANGMEGERVVKSEEDGAEQDRGQRKEDRRRTEHGGSCEEETGGGDDGAEFTTEMFEKTWAKVRLLQASLPEAQAGGLEQDGGPTTEDKRRREWDGGGTIPGGICEEGDAAANEELLAKARADLRLVQTMLKAHARKVLAEGFFEDGEDGLRAEETFGRRPAPNMGDPTAAHRQQSVDARSSRASISNLESQA